MKSLFSKFSIKKQIIAGFLPVLFVLTLLVFLSHYNFQAFFKNFDALSTNTTESLIFNAIEHDMAEMQRSVLVYSYVGYSGVLNKIDYLQQKIENNFQSIKPLIETNPEISDRYQRMIKHYHAYKNGFDDVVEEREHMRSILKTQMRPLSSELHGIFDDAYAHISEQRDFKMQLQISELKQIFLQAEHNVEIFDRSFDSSMIADTQMYLQNILSSADVFDAYDFNHGQTVRDIGSEYQKLFSDLTKINRVYSHLINVVLAGKSSEISYLFDEIRTLLSVQTSDLNTDILNAMKRAQANYILLSALAAFIGLVFAWAVASGISKPVSEMAVTLNSLSAGEANVTIPGHDRYDELGDMAKAANAFKNMALRLSVQTELLRESEEQFRTAMQYSAVGFALVAPDGKLLEVNKALCDLLGYTEADLMDRTFDTLTHSDDFESGADYIQKILDKEIETYRVEQRYFHQNGDIIWGLLNVSVVWNDDKTAKHFIFQIQDITDRKKAEDELIRSNEELERFAYIASHDLQEPARMVYNFSQILIETSSDLLDDKSRKYLDFVHDGSLRMRTMISDLLDYSRVGSDEVAAVEFNPQDQLDAVLQSFDDVIKAHKAVVYVENMPEILKGNPMRFSRVLQNLIGNALKYKHPDRVPEIVIHAKDRTTMWEFSVRDNGIGIQPEYLDQIFVIFKRLHNKNEYSGTGIGLAVCQKIVESAGGRLWAESEYGEGSTFSFTLPQI